MAQVGGNWKLSFYSEIYKNADVILELGQANKDPSKGKSSKILIEVDPNFALGMLKTISTFSDFFATIRFLKKQLQTLQLLNF